MQAFPANVPHAVEVISDVSAYSHDVIQFNVVSHSPHYWDEQWITTEDKRQGVITGDNRHAVITGAIDMA